MSDGNASPGANKADTGASQHGSGNAQPQAGCSSASPCGQVKSGDRLDQLAKFFEDAAPRPEPGIAMAGAIGTAAGILGKCYNTFTGAGLNQYIMVLAKSGLGKDAIDSGQAKLLSSISHIAITVNDGIPNNAKTFRGCEIVSAPGLIKWIEKNPSFMSCAGEFGYFLQRVTAARPSPNDLAILQFFLRIYSKSGEGNVFDPMAYSQVEKQTKPIIAPAFSIVAESVPDVVYDNFNENMIRNGLLPRFLIGEITGERAPLNENPLQVPDDELRQWFADLCGYALQLNHHNQVIRVPTDKAGGDLLREFDRWCDAEIRAHNSEGVRELWNRAHLKALKLATLRAVLNHHLDPVVTLTEAQWATNLVNSQTCQLIGKFEAGEVGSSLGDINAQQNAMIKVIADYLHKPWNDSYHGKSSLKDDYLITKNYLHQRCNNIKAFYAHGAMRRKVIDDTIYSLLEGDLLAQIKPDKVWADHKTRASCYIVSNPDFFLKQGGYL